MTSVNQAPIKGQGSVSGRIWLCADDFALNDAISEAILALLDSGRLSITSCMTQSGGWPRWGGRLKDAGYASRAGLHFNLTEPFKGAFQLPLGRLMLQSSLRLLSREMIRGGLQKQLDAYEAVMHVPPSFVDGHQHVHVFPVIRDLLLEELDRRYSARPSLRNVSPPRIARSSESVKSKIIQTMGGAKFERQLESLHWPRNGCFAGIYDLKPDAPYATLMQGWLNSMQHGQDGLIMCHPATRAEPGDVIGPARVAEYSWLTSDAWPEMLRASGVVLAQSGMLEM